MIFMLAALLAAGQPAPSAPPPVLGRTAWIFGTVSQSEFCPAGNVRLDLRTGRYQFTEIAPQRTCHEPGLERPVRVGRLSGAPLEAARTAYLRALGDGLENPVCREGRRPDVIVVNNGGTPILILATGRFTVSPPDDLACWSEAASALHEELERLFPSAGERALARTRHAPAPGRPR
jgi:hypothetical protein